MFTTFPAYGHLLPMVPLARAAAAAGDQVVVATSKELHEAVDQAIDGLEVRTLKPSLPDLLKENERQSGQDILEFKVDSSDESDTPDLLAATTALFTTTRADVGFARLCELAAQERPDVIVAEMWDYLAPMVASRLDIPWVSLIHSPATPLDGTLEQGLAKALKHRGLTMPTRLATVQLWPEWLELAAPAESTSIAIEPVPYDTLTPADLPDFDGTRPVVLVTLGTVVEDLALLNSAIAGVLDAGADALVTTGFSTRPDEIASVPDRVHAVPFAPISQLLDRVDAVITVGGSGTTLAALSRGLPIGFVPRMANQPLVASLVSNFGAGTVIDDETDMAKAVSEVLDDQELRAHAQTAAKMLDQRPSPSIVWSALRDRVHVSKR